MRPLAFAAASLLAVLPCCASLEQGSAPLAAVAAPTMVDPLLLAQVPADAQVCVAWNMLEHPGYAGSRTAKFVALSQQEPITEAGMARDWKEAITLLIKLQGNDRAIPPHEMEMTALAADLLAAASMHGGALYVHGFEMQRKVGEQVMDGPVLPSAVLLVRAPKNGQQLLDQRNALVKKYALKTPGVAEFKNGILRVSFNMTGQPEPWIKPADSLAKSPRFLATTRSFGRNPGMLIYADAGNLVERLKAFDAWQKKTSGHSGIEFEKMDAITGLSGLKTLAFAGNFTHDGQWRWDGLVEAPAPRKGMLTMMDGATVSPELLLRVPASAEGFTAAGFDLNATLNTVLALVATQEPAAPNEWNKGLALAKAQTGVDVNALIAGLGNQWLAFSDPMATGGGLLGTVVVSPLRDGPAVETNLNKAVDMGTAMLKQQMAKEKSPLNIGFFADTARGVTVQRLGIPLVSPGYAVQNNTLYASLFPQAIQGAVRPVTRPLVATAAYAVLKAQVLPASVQPRMISYSDLSRVAPHSYGTGLLLHQWGAGLGEMVTGKPNPSELPVLSDLLPVLGPDMSAVWTDAQGLHWRSQGPFPGAALVAGIGMDGLPMISTVALGAGILVPVLAVARKNANVMKVSLNARNVGMGAEVFATSNKDYYPGWTPRGKRAEGNYSGLAHLLLESAIAPAQITSLTGNTPACPTMDPATGTLRRGTPEDFKLMDAWIRAHSSVIFIPDIRSTYLRQGQPVPAIRSNQDHQRIMAFIDPAMAIDPKKLAVVRGDTATTTESQAELDEQLQAQYGATSDELAAEFREGKVPAELPAK